MRILPGIARGRPATGVLAPGPAGKGVTDRVGEISIATSSLFDSLLALIPETDNIYQLIEIMSGL
jgi:hypothetical protein